MKDNLINQQESKVVKLYPWFYFIFFFLVAIIISIWGNAFLKSIGLAEKKALIYGIGIFFIMILTSIFNFWLDKKLFMKYFIRGDLKKLKFNLIFYVIFIALVLIASPFLILATSGQGIGKILLGVLLGFGLLQAIFYYLRIKESKAQISDYH
jgi:hypothetical protein